MFATDRQAILFPLTVAARNYKAGDARRETAERLLMQMKAHSPELLEQAQMVSEELIRVAVLWSEMWNEALEEVHSLHHHILSLLLLILLLLLLSLSFSSVCLDIHLSSFYLTFYFLKASKMFSENDMEGMFALLTPLHDQMRGVWWGGREEQGFNMFKSMD